MRSSRRRALRCDPRGIACLDSFGMWISGVYEPPWLHGVIGVKVVSISQETPEDSSGQLARRMFSAFDEYQSQENSKHTSRAMRENARQGFFNGSRPPSRLSGRGDSGSRQSRTA